MCQGQRQPRKCKEVMLVMLWYTELRAGKPWKRARTLLPVGYPFSSIQGNLTWRSCDTEKQIAIAAIGSLACQTAPCGLKASFCHHVWPLGRSPVRQCKTSGAHGSGRVLRVTVAVQHGSRPQLHAAGLWEASPGPWKGIGRAPCLRV